ncbi:TPA: integrating conjugative element protein [Stenotrophomonas maltophilia]|nr:integrating conjugative element protein [Stenotrophomonas maltophilia]HDS1154655.1 integrating conjugative element protein [Stenotrophomonas maltophilia]HDS1167512.1 integrating conjugative element protein [Stenotrophomonas maltophilia]HDS1170658.1 integrating conjugative element protein [Stenotrophomonas maltophilia]HDS1180283.1 integrating conjugative element protein [Stenotrophomonas maltophilia]
MNISSRGLLVALLAVTSTVHSADSPKARTTYEATGSVLGDDVLYSIGGGRAVSMSGAADMRSIGIGVGWNSNLICGNMDLSATLQNQLNGVTNGFQSIMSSVIQNATSAVASLPAMIIQRADPALYNLLSNGILQGRLDFDRSKASCQAMANRMADMAGAQLGWDQLAQGQALGQSTAGQNTDAVAAIEQSEQARGNKGVPWVGGQQAGGQGQAPIKLISDVSRAGYNLLNGRQVGDRSSIGRDSCGNRLSCQTWESPQAAADFATRVLGEREQRTCDGCSKTQTTPGVGLTPLIQEEYDRKLQALQALVNGSAEPTPEQLADAGSHSLPITRGVIEALRDEADSRLLTQRLASEVALASVLEKALLLQRTLLTGRKEPNVAINNLAQQAISSESDTLAQEINNLKTELELRQTLAGNSAMVLIQRHSTV